MRRMLPVLLVAACASLPKSTYVPGGTDLPVEARETFREAVAQERAGEIDAALATLDSLCAAYPLRLGLHLHRLRLAKRHKGGTFAANLYVPAPAGMDPERAAFLVRLATMPEHEVAEREGLMEAATALEPREPFWRLGLADVRLSAHDLILERAERQRDLGQSQAAAESLHEARRVLEEARQEAETALDYDKNFKEAHVLLGYIYTRIGESETEIEKRDEQRNAATYHYGLAVELDEQCVVARLNLAENMLYFGEYGDAARELRIAVKLAPREARAWNNLGVTYYATGRLGSAESAYRTALEIEPEDARIRTALADCLRRLGDEAGAIEELSTARRHADGDRAMLAVIAFKLAAIHEHEGAYQEAVKEYERHIELGGPDSAKARSRIRHIYDRAFEK